MMKNQGFDCKKRRVHCDYDLWPVWLRLGSGITTAGGKN
jgi:hypothetical protein